MIKINAEAQYPVSETLFVFALDSEAGRAFDWAVQVHLASEAFKKILFS